MAGSTVVAQLPGAAAESAAGAGAEEITLQLLYQLEILAGVQGPGISAQGRS